MKLNSPNEIYSVMLTEINALILSLKTETDDDDIRKAQDNAQRQLESIHEEIKSLIKSLQSNAEWDVFTIAFYGETNAGKSTLIETLRILLKELTKEKEREKFKINIELMQNIEKQLEQSEDLLNKISGDYQPKISEFEDGIKSINVAKENVDVQLRQLKENSEKINNQIIVKRKTSMISYIKFILKILDEQKESRMIAKKILESELEILDLDQKQLEMNQLIKTIKEEWDKKSEHIKKINESFKKEIKQIESELLECCDGKIIGDGRSDFTRTVTTYQFDCNGQKFDLLDLPGIEGKEDLVLDVINDSVQKAHAVFYVSGQARPPQTGDNGNEGTLEKIKKHLGQQTEVYSIFNKKTPNPMNLKPGLIKDDEKESLEELDAVMQDKLGEQYKKHIVLSAYPAFLAVANCFQDNFINSQKNFIDKFNSPQNLLKESLVKDFSDWITIDLVRDCKSKIKKSNYKKIRVALNTTSYELDEIYKSFNNFQKKLNNNKAAVDRQLDDSVESLKKQLNLVAKNAVNEFKTTLRVKVYAEIDKEIDNDEFKNVFECRKNEAIDRLAINLKEKFDKVIEEFKSEIEDVLEKYNRYELDLLSAYKNAAQFDFDFIPDIDIKSNVNWTGTITSIVSGVGGVLLWLSNPAGWVVLALSIIGAIISFGKAVLGFFNHSYRASQQKETADNNIETIGNQIEESLIVNLKDANQPLADGINIIKKKLMKSVNHIKSMNQILKKAQIKFDLLTKIAENEGVN